MFSIYVEMLVPKAKSEKKKAAEYLMPVRAHLLQ